MLGGAAVVRQTHLARFQAGSGSGHHFEDWWTQETGYDTGLPRLERAFQVR